MNIYAHRGASADYPENTLIAFRSAIELGADGIELDVRISKDGVPVVMHDADVSRTTNCDGTIADMYLADIKKLDAGNGEHVPTVEEVLLLTKGKISLDIEIKAAGAEKPVLQMLAGWSRENVVISSFDWDVLRRCRAADPELVLWPLTHGATDEAVAVAHELGAPLLALDEKFIDADIVAFVHAEKLGFMAWTVDDPKRAEELRRLGATDLCTNDPATMIAAMARRRQANPV